MARSLDRKYVRINVDPVVRMPKTLVAATSQLSKLEGVSMIGVHKRGEQVITKGVPQKDGLFSTKYVMKTSDLPKSHLAAMDKIYSGSSIDKTYIYQVPVGYEVRYDLDAKKYDLVQLETNKVVQSVSSLDKQFMKVLQVTKANRREN